MPVLDPQVLKDDREALALLDAVLRQTTRRKAARKATAGFARNGRTVGEFHALARPGENEMIQHRLADLNG